MDGILNVNKPAGLTSFGAVAAIRKITGEKRTGHAGTLDPLATGVLPVCLGQATRIVEYLQDETKTYQAEIRLGLTTDTYDITGNVIRTADAGAVRREDVETILARFKGTVQQKPPAFSAVKHHGQPLYKLARAGISVEKPDRLVRIDSIRVLDWQPPGFTLEIICGKGTYVRSIAHDLGEVLGCGAVMAGLVRRQVGPFTLDKASTLPEIEAAFRRDLGTALLYPLDYFLPSYPALVVSTEQQSVLVHGNPVTFEPGAPEPADGTLSRVYTLDGSFLGMARYAAADRQWRPVKIFFRGNPAQSAGGVAE
jgi:tRNA pseudouridine55 synthase